MSALYTEQPIIMSSINAFHPISGVTNKLIAYHEFLKKYPNYRKKVVLI